MQDADFVVFVLNILIARVALITTKEELKQFLKDIDSVTLKEIVRNEAERKGLELKEVENHLSDV